MALLLSCRNSIVTTAAMGSTSPDAAPHAKAFVRLRPSLCRGKEIIAPSGMFCIAIPVDSASAPAVVSPASPLMTPPRTTPTAMPSGMLCRATARIIFIERGRRECGPSGLCSSMCWWGMTVSSSSRKHMPTAKPASTGHVLPMPSPACSSAGCSNDQKLAATITPDAKPSIALFMLSLMPLRSMKTIAAPRAVPRNGMVSPIIISIYCIALLCTSVAKLLKFAAGDAYLCNNNGTNVVVFTILSFFIITFALSACFAPCHE